MTIAQIEAAAKHAMDVVRERDAELDHTSPFADSLLFFSLRLAFVLSPVLLCISLSISIYNLSIVIYLSTW